jgi:RND family efflux transporter MFP subunit
VTPAASLQQSGVPARLHSILWVAGLLIACGQAQPDVEQLGAGQTLQRDIVPVETLVLRAVDHVDRFEVAGLIAADEDVVISSEISGRITHVGFDRGDTVEKGRLLIRLDDAAVQAQIRRLRATINREKAQLELSRKDRDREARLFEEGVGAEKAFDDADSRVQVMDEMVKEAEAAVDEAVVLERKHDIHAPVGGKIAERHVSLGEYVNPGTPLAHLVKIDEVKFEFALAERDVPRVRAGQELDFSIDAYPGQEFRAPIALISPAGSELTRTFAVTLKLKNNQERPILPGMSGRARVIRAEHEGVYLLPEDAVLSDAEGAYLYLLRGDRAERADVEIVSSLGPMAVVKADLEPEAECVILGQYALSSGSAVMVRRKHEEPPVVRFD